MLKKHGWRLDRFIHNYIYFRFYYPYVKSVYYVLKYSAGYLYWLKPLNTVLSSSFSRYHAKVLSYGDTKKILTLNVNISSASPANKKIIPYKYAYKVIFEEPGHIAVMDCPCKITLGDRDENIASCLAVGKSLSSFWIEHGSKYHAKKITQKDALELVERLRKKGYITQAFLKVATGGHTGVICNCHPDTCVSLKATRFAKKFDEKLNMNAESGYSIEWNMDLCGFCGTCARICPVECIRISGDRIRDYDKNACIGCELCAEHCPQKALSIYPDPNKTLPLDMNLFLHRK